MASDISQRLRRGEVNIRRAEYPAAQPEAPRSYTSSGICVGGQFRNQRTANSGERRKSPTIKPSPLYYSAAAQPSCILHQPSRVFISLLSVKQPEQSSCTYVLFIYLSFLRIVQVIGLRHHTPHDQYYRLGNLSIIYVSSISRAGVVQVRQRPRTSTSLQEATRHQRVEYFRCTSPKP